MCQADQQQTENTLENLQLESPFQMENNASQPHPEIQSQSPQYQRFPSSDSKTITEVAESLEESSAKINAKAFITTEPQ